MSFPQGRDFRATLGFVTDPTNYSGEIATTNNYPTTSPQGNSVGWVVNAPGNIRNRNAGNDPRLAGIAFEGTGAVAAYEIDLPSAGSYTVFLAVGDANYAKSNQKAELFDNTTSLGVLFTGASTGAANSFLDATGVVRTAAAWPGSNAGVTNTFASTKCILKICDGTNITDIASFFVQAASTPPATCAPTLSLLGVGCGIQAVRAMIRNRIIGRRGVVAELLGVNDE